MTGDKRNNPTSSRRDCLRLLGALSLLALPRSARAVPAPAALLVLLEDFEGRELAALPEWPRWTATGTLLSPVREIDDEDRCTVLLAGGSSPRLSLTDAVAASGGRVALVSAGSASTLDAFASETAQALRVGCAALGASATVESHDEVLLAALRAAGVDLPAVQGALLQRRILRRGLVPAASGEDARMLTAASAALELVRELPAMFAVLRLTIASRDARATVQRVVTDLARAATGTLSVLVACVPTTPLPAKQEPLRSAALLFGARFKQGFTVRSGVSLLDIAPLTAHILGVKLPESKGRLLRSVLA